MTKTMMMILMSICMFFCPTGLSLICLIYFIEATYSILQCHSQNDFFPQTVATTNSLKHILCNKIRVFKHKLVLISHPQLKAPSDGAVLFMPNKMSAYACCTHTQSYVCSDTNMHDSQWICRVQSAQSLWRTASWRHTAPAPPLGSIAPALKVRKEIYVWL